MCLPIRSSTASFLLATILFLRNGVGSSQPMNSDTTLPLYENHHVGSSTRVSPTPYPMAFRIQFDTNITRQKIMSDNGDTIDPTTNSLTENNKPLRSTLYYDWKLQAQRIDHPPGSYECVRFYNVSKTGCQLYFTAVGMYRVISQSRKKTTGSTVGSSWADADDCCLDIPGLGAPPPDWARRASPTFKGLVKDVYSGYDAYEFVFDRDLSYPWIANQHYETDTTTTRQRESNHEQHGDVVRGTSHRSIYDQFHTAREVHDDTTLVSDGTPLSFTFPSKAMGLQDYHFDPTSLVIGDQDPELFRLPAGCALVRCSSNYDLEELI